MKKKIILAVASLVLLLIFASSGYAGPDPNYRLKADPWQHMLSPKPDNDQGLDLVVLVINNHFYLVFKSQYDLENSSHFDKLTDQQSSSSVKLPSLNIRNETEPKK